MTELGHKSCIYFFKTCVILRIFPGMPSKFSTGIPLEILSKILLKFYPVVTSENFPEIPEEIRSEFFSGSPPEIC